MTPDDQSVGIIVSAGPGDSSAPQSLPDLSPAHIN